MRELVRWVLNYSVYANVLCCLIKLITFNLLNMSWNKYNLKLIFCVFEIKLHTWPSIYFWQNMYHFRINYSILFLTMSLSPTSTINKDVPVNLAQFSEQLRIIQGKILKWSQHILSVTWFGSDQNLKTIM